MQFQAINRIGNGSLFLGLVALQIIFLVFMHYEVMNQDRFYAVLGEQMELDRITGQLQFAEKLRDVIIAAAPLFLFIRITMSALLLQMVTLVQLIEIPFSRIWAIVMRAMVITLAGEWSQIMLLNFVPDEEFISFLNTIPLSLTMLVDPSVYPGEALYVFNQINAFEVMWCFLIYRGLIHTDQMKKETALNVTLILWAVIFLYKTIAALIMTSFWGLG